MNILTRAATRTCWSLHCIALNLHLTGPDVPLATRETLAEPGLKESIRVGKARAPKVTLKYIPQIGRALDPMQIKGTRLR